MKRGDLEIHTIVEMRMPLMPILTMMPNLTEAMLEPQRPELERSGGLSEDGQLLIAVRSFVVRTPEHTIVVDAGVGNDKERPNHPAWNKKQDTAWMDGLAAAGVTPEQVDMVICTHLHVDHIGWNTRLEQGRWVPTFPNARYVLGRTEYEFWSDQNDKAASPVFQDSVLPVMQAGQVDLVASDASVAPHVRLLPTPGHTPGHVSVLLGDGAAVIAGDVAHTALQFAHPDVSPRFDSDPELAARTRGAFFERFAGTPTAIFFTHPPVAPLTLRREGDQFGFDPA